tara:strand:- start:8728 stop:9294 length:567 start_codon:yes stop_codon:yes gene_type:complete
MKKFNEFVAEAQLTESKFSKVNKELDKKMKYMMTPEYAKLNKKAKALYQKEIDKLALAYDAAKKKVKVNEAKDDVKFTPAEYKLIEKFAQKNLSVDGYVHVEGEYMITISNEVGEGRATVRNSTYVKKVGPGTSNGFHQYVVSSGSELVSRSRWPLAPKNKKFVASSDPFEGTSDLKELKRVLTKAVK